MRPDQRHSGRDDLLVGALFHLIPRLRKRNLYFGVTGGGEGFRESRGDARLPATFEC